MITTEDVQFLRMFAAMIFVFGPIILLCYGHGIRTHYKVINREYEETNPQQLPCDENWIVIEPRQLNGKMEIVKYD